jgi:hypothetical protein
MRGASRTDVSDGGVRAGEDENIVLASAYHVRGFPFAPPNLDDLQ